MKKILTRRFKLKKQYFSSLLDFPRASGLATF